MKLSIKKFIFVFLVLLIPFSGVFAAQDEGIYTYSFHLYFDENNLVTDRDFSSSFDLIAEKFENPEVTGTVFRGEIWSVSGKKLADFVFAVSTIKGKLTVSAPYFDNAKKADFYNSQNQKLLTIDLAPSGPVCNEDKQCNNDTGETYLNCPSDCSAPTPFPSVTPFPPTFNYYYLFLNSSAVWVGLAVVLVAIAIWLWLRRRRNMPPV